MNPTCPTCGATTTLVNLRDGDQGYWCDTCQEGWRIGVWPLVSRKGKGTDDRTQRPTPRPDRRAKRHPR